MRRFQHEVPSFEKAFAAEIVGVLSVHEGEISEILLRMFEENGHKLEPSTKREFLEFREMMVRALVNCFRYAKPKMAARLPSAYIHAMCHAAVRMDVKRKFNGNFLRDLHHGSAGVGYHDAMFTENPLRVLLMSGNVAVGKTFDCLVLSDETEVVKYLQGLG